MSALSGQVKAALSHIILGAVRDISGIWGLTAVVRIQIGGTGIERVYG
jgi:hypothetical protein